MAGKKTGETRFFFRLAPGFFPVTVSGTVTACLQCAQRVQKWRQGCGGGRLYKHFLEGKTEMTEEQKKKIVSAAVALAAAYAVWKFAPGGQAVKAAALGVVGMVVAVNTPYVKNAFAA